MNDITAIMVKRLGNRGAGGSNRGGRRGANQAVSRAQFMALKNELLGHKIIPTMNPPVFVERPWNSFTFQRTDVTTANFQTDSVTVGDIIGAIRGRFNINPVGAGDIGNLISIKIQEARVWCTASALTLPDIEVSFFELAYTGTQSIRHTQRDIGTLNVPAKVGYGFPASDSKEILDDGDASKLVLTSTATISGSNVTPRVQVLWRSSN